MARPRKNRCIRRMPTSTFYKPRGVALHDMKGVTLPLEGLEALRLVDAERVSREEAAQMMDVSTPTLCRILAEARSIVARALANGWALRIEGGDYTFVDQEHQKHCEPPLHCRRRKRRQKSTT
ncbi:DUF134 domain-containing protein [Desulfolithobacter sp.]